MPDNDNIRGLIEILNIKTTLNFKFKLFFSLISFYVTQDFLEISALIRVNEEIWWATKSSKSLKL